MCSCSGLSRGILNTYAPPLFGIEIQYAVLGLSRMSQIRMRQYTPIAMIVQLLLSNHSTRSLIQSASVMRLHGINNIHIYYPLH